MEDISKKRLYKKIVLKLLRDQKRTINELLSSLNSILINDILPNNVYFDEMSFAEICLQK